MKNLVNPLKNIFLSLCRKLFGKGSSLSHIRLHRIAYLENFESRTHGENTPSMTHLLESADQKGDVFGILYFSQSDANS